MKSKSLKWIIWTILSALVSLVGLTIIIPFILPAYVERKLIPGLAQDLNLAPTQVHVQRIGWWGSKIGPVRLTSNNTPAITIEELNIDYSPLSLLQGEVRGITLEGVGIDLAVTPQGLVVAGRQLSFKGSPEADRGRINLKTLLPIGLGHFSVLQSRLEVNWNDHRYTVPIEFNLQTKPLKKGKLKGYANLIIADNPLRIQLSIDQMANNARIGFDLHNFLLDKLTQFNLLPETIKATGTTNLSGWGAFELGPFNLTGLEISGELTDTQIATPVGVLKTPTFHPKKPEPLEITIKGDNLSKLKWSFSPFHIHHFLNLDIDNIAGNLAYTDGYWSVDSDITARIPEQKLPNQLDIKTNLTINGHMAVRGTDFKNGIEFDLRSHWGRSVISTAEGRKFTGKRHHLNVNGHVQHGVLTTQGKFTAKELELDLPEGTLNIPRVDIDCTLTNYPTDADLASTMSADVKIPDVHSQFGSTAVILPEIILQASGKQAPDHRWQFNTRTRISSGRVTDTAKGLQMANLSLDLPLDYPVVSSPRTGRVNINAIQWNKRRLGGITGTLQQTPQSININLRHFSKLIPGLRVLVDGAIQQSGARIEAQIPHPHLVDELDLGSVAPLAAGFKLTGQFGASAELIIGGNGVSGSAHLTVKKGRVNQESQTLLLDGIHMDVRFDDLIKMHSAPRQRLHIDHLSFGDLKAEHLDMDFQVEGFQTLWINRAGIHWSRGTIKTSDVRITPGAGNYDVTLICERLHLATVLEQLGVARAEGEGSVNGRIPIRWVKGQLSIDNGYLISPPGRTGIIRLSGTQRVLIGLPPGTPQHTQLDIATEALKDYTYKSAGLEVRSEADHLLLKLQLDGKPNRLLPFAYDQSIGQFKRVAGEGQTKFKGISIDFTVRSPINEIFHYKDLLRQQ
jgi:hypothetical protein